MPVLTEEMLLRDDAGTRARSLNPLRRKKPAAPGAVGQLPGGQGAVSDSYLPESPVEQNPPAGRNGGKGKKAEQDEAPSGNGWFHNPFAKPKTASSAGDRSNVSSAQMWAGPRRGVLLRRLLGLFAVFLLLFLFMKINGKASKAQVEAAVDARVKSAADTFPRGAAVMWSAPVVKLFATYDKQHVDDRGRALRPYAINGIDPQLGWNGQGKQSVIDLVMSPDVQMGAPGHAVVRGTVQIQDGSWRCVAVPMYTVNRGGSTAFGLTSSPVYVPCGGLTSPPQDKTAGGASNDSALSATLKAELLPPFLAAWAQSDTVNLDRYLLPGSVSFGLGGAYTGTGDGGRPTVESVYVPVPAKSGKDADRRTVTFTTTLLSVDGKAEQKSTYRVLIVKRNGQWYFGADPTPAVGMNGGEQVPNVQPSEGTGGMYSQSPAPYPRATTSTGVQQPAR
ncbi:hypothetical protein ACGFMM_10815 [Streptomyces sp. NPDC048604]|uniref:hypothetical protein n=1 Tax=Streptomyces sp. NPDC048604 TaxID=3365578 RepID=UPI00371CF6BB